MWHNLPLEIGILEVVGQFLHNVSVPVRGLAAMLESKTPVIRNSTKLEPIDSSLETIISRSLRAAPASESPLLAWPLACGSAVADRTRAMEYSKGVLSIEVADKGWRTELQRLAPQYLAVINRYTGRIVNRIEFVVQSKTQNEEVRSGSKRQ